jgi:hypothetical protein
MTKLGQDCLAYGVSLIQEVFLETDWDEVSQARAARDERAAQLQAQGFTCSCSNLYRATDGRRVFLVEAESPEDQQESDRKSLRQKSSSRRPRPKDRETPKVEYR